MGTQITDRVVEIRVEGIRTLERVRLSLRAGVTTLIGENGTGKSTLIEVCELLRKVGSASRFLDEFNKIHQGLFSLLRYDAGSLRIGVRIEGAGDPLDYDLSIGIEGDRAVIVGEFLRLGPKKGHSEPLRVIDRTRSSTKVFDQTRSKPVEVAVDFSKESLLLTSFGFHPPQNALRRVVNALQSIEVHPSFDVGAAWVTRGTRRRSPLRESVGYLPADRLELLGENLANVFAALKNEHSETWSETMDYVRLGLGRDIESVNTRPDPGGGAIALSLKVRGVDRQVPAAVLSDGTLAFLALVALVRLPRPRALLAIDEIESHLHPKLLVHALGMLQTLGKRCPVLMATHSDRLLDALEDPAESVALCELDGNRSTQILRPEKQALTRWLKDYRGLGDIRSEGFENTVLTVGEAPPEPLKP